MGQKYRTGEDADTLSRFRHLAAWGKANCGLERLSHRWATHDLMPPDGLPYVGLYHAAAQNLWMCAGMRQWGMTMGTHAAHMLAALIRTGKHEDADLYSPQRGAQLTAGAPKLIMDQINVGKHVSAPAMAIAACLRVLTQARRPFCLCSGSWTLLRRWPRRLCRPSSAAGPRRRRRWAAARRAC